MALFRALGSTFPSYVCRSKIVGRWGGKAAHSLRKMWRAFVHAEYFERRDLEGRDETGCTGSPHFAMSIEVRLLEPQFVSWMKWDEVAPVLDRNGGARSEMDHVIMDRKVWLAYNLGSFTLPSRRLVSQSYSVPKNYSILFSLSSIPLQWPELDRLIEPSDENRRYFRMGVLMIMEASKDWIWSSLISKKSEGCLAYV